MRPLAPRFGSRIRRHRLLLGFAALAGAFALLVLPRLTRSSTLELVALDQDGRFHEEITVPDRWAGAAPAGGGARVPLVLAVRNTGGEAVRPARLHLSVPVRFRLSASEGAPLVGHMGPGGPLIRYELSPAFPPIEAGRLPVLLPSPDTVWLEVLIPAFYCVALSDSIPEFVPAPPPPIDLLRRVQIFYSFEGGDLEDRQTGLLTVHLDSALLRREAPEPPPLYPADVRPYALPLPSMGALRYAGSRRSRCGEPEAPVELFTTLWETPNGGRFFVLDYGGAARKYLFDLNRDSILELEMWDPDADGDFEARRSAQLPIPAFLMPPPPPPPFDFSVFAAIPDDSLVRLRRFRHAMLRPEESRAPRPDSSPRLDRFRPTTIVRADIDRERPSAARPGAARPGAAPPGATPTPAGATPAPAPPPAPRAPLLGVPVEPEPPAPTPAPAPARERERPAPRPARPAPPAAAEPEPDRPAAEPAPAEPPPSRPEPRLLGRPVEPEPDPSDAPGDRP